MTNWGKLDSTTLRRLASDWTGNASRTAPVDECSELCYCASCKGEVNAVRY